MPIVTEDSQPKRRRAPWWVLVFALAATLGLATCSLHAFFPVETQVGNLMFYSGPDDFDVDIQGQIGVFSSRNHFSAHLKVFGWAHRVSVFRVNVVHGMVITPIERTE